MESGEMSKRILVIILISAFAFEVVQANIIGRNGSYTRESKDLLEDTVNRVNDSLIQHFTTFESYTNVALNNRLILDVDDDVFALVTVQNKTLSLLESALTEKNYEAVALGPMYSYCVHVEAAEGIVHEGVAGLKACVVPAEEFLQEYDTELDDYIQTTQSVSQYAYNRVFDCLPESDDPSEEEMNQAVRCINYEQVGAHRSLSLLEQMLVSNQYNNERTAESLFDEGYVCIDEAIELASTQSEELINIIDACIAINRKRNPNHKVTMDDLQVVIDETNATLTNTCEVLNDNLNELMDSEFIDNVISETTTRVHGANETIFRMINETFRIIEETEAGGNYGNCLVGVREKAQNILDQAVNHLPQCVLPLEDLNRECHEDLLSLISLLESEKQIAQHNVMLCVPSGEEPSQEEISLAISCVDTESLKAQQSFSILQQELDSLIEDTVNELDVLTYDARRCVDTSAHVAGDQTGYLRFVLDQCLADVVSSSTDDHHGSSTVDPLKVTLDDLQDALDRSNASLLERYSSLDDEINYALNSQIILNAELETKAKISNSQELLVTMITQAEAKISEAEAKNVTECVQGVRDELLAILDDAIDAIRECATPIEEIANVYEEQILASVEQSGNIKEALIKKVFACVPSASVPTADEIEEAIACVDLETADGLNVMTLQERVLRSDVERSSRRASSLGDDVTTCVDDKIDDASLDIDDLIQDVADCILDVFYTDTDF